MVPYARNLWPSEPLPIGNFHVKKRLVNKLSMAVDKPQPTMVKIYPSPIIHDILKKIRRIHGCAKSLNEYRLEFY